MRTLYTIFTIFYESKTSKIKCLLKIQTEREVKQKMTYYCSNKN